MARRLKTKVEGKEWPLIVRKQANRLKRLFELPFGHEGREESIEEYRAALQRNGVENPPTNLNEACAFITEVGEFNG